MIKKQHSIFGTIEFNVDVKQEHDCRLCVHSHVCSRDLSKFCNNHRHVGDSGGANTNPYASQPFASCVACFHKHTHFNRDIPCFQCKHYEEDQNLVDSVLGVKQEFPDMNSDEFMSRFYEARSVNPGFSDEKLIKEIKKKL